MIQSLFIALTLLLLSFLSALEHLGWLRHLAADAGMPRWLPELLLAALAAAAFIHASRLKQRLLHPRRGNWLLAAGIAAYALGLAAAMGLLAQGGAWMANELGGEWSRAPGLIALLYPQPLLILAQALLAFGAFRALSNLVPPNEFAEDF